MTTVTVRWVAATDADIDTDYKIQSDEAAAGTFADITTQNSTDRGDGSYTPYSTTLNGALSESATSLTLTDGTNFPNGAYIWVGRECILLAGKSSNSYSGCTRGVAGTKPEAQSNGATIYRMHESYSDDVTFGSRYVVRHRVIRIQGGDQSVAAEATSIKPPVPPQNNLCCLYGILKDPQGNVQNGISASLTISLNNNYVPSESEIILQTTETTTSDADGFFYFFVNKDNYKNGASDATYTVTINSDLAWSVDVLPDQDAINILET